MAEMGWRSNTIVASAGTVIAGLVKGDPGLRGSMWWAVGAGRPSWDRTPEVAASGSSKLVNEILRREVTPAEIFYVDHRGKPCAEPCARIRLKAMFQFSKRTKLREFGLFAGGATRDRESGLLVNYVIHPVIELPGRRCLDRELHLDFGVGTGVAGSGTQPHDPVTQAPDEEPIDAPDVLSLLSGEVPGEHWLRSVPAKRLVGLESATANEMEKAKTLGDLAAWPAAPERGQAALVRTATRLLLRTAVNLSPPPELEGRTVLSLLGSVPEKLARETGLDVARIRLLQETLSIFLLLDRRLLHGVSIRKLRYGQ
jgi:hypothetical protein